MNNNYENLDTEWFYGHIKGKPAEKGFFPRHFVDIV